jgi:outer membrane receptor protein involved in Fe transport
VVLYPNGPKVATTDFFQLGASTQVARFSMSSDFFLIDRSNEQVYVPDDGSIEFRGPSRSYGWETKFSVQLLRHLSWNSGVTQVSNGFYRGTFPRQYVDSAPHTVVNSGLTLADWKGFFSSLRYRHIGGYILDPVDRTARATGLDVVDLAVTKKLRKGFEANVAIDNVTNHRYYETQNWFQSRLTPTASPEFRVHGTPGYGVGVTAGLTFRWE